jgi:signal transduction histidine kinase
MTLRLVALMSVVLLLSLGAFGLLMAHYQDQVMEEVTRTASVVGRTALGTWEARAAASPFPGAVGGDEGGAVFFWTDSCSGETAGECDAHLQKLLGESAPSFAFVHEFSNVVDTDGQVRIVRRELTTRDGEPAVHMVCEGDGGTPDEEGQLDCTVRREGEGARAGQARFFISVEDVRAESNPAEGLVLKIPTFAADEEGANRFEPAPGGARALAHMGEIHLPIPVEEDYRELFADVRKRSMLMAVGVFVVGTVLSAGLASRFTRPIRRLDAGIRSLSDGDLDVEVPTRGEDEIARLGAAFNDMTRKLRANRERSRQLVRKEKLSALGRLAAGVAHDVRNPLHSIGLTLQHLEDAGRPRHEPESGEFGRAVDVIRGEVRRLDGLVGNFLRFADSGRGERHDVNLGALLGEIVQLVSKEAERRGVTIDLQVEPDAPLVRGDGESLRSAVLNLVLNSFEAMPEGGRLRIALQAEDGELLLDVEDDGRGIPQQDHERVFDFAYTTRDDGHGLGLAMVHHCVVEDHGGRVDLDSRPGHGTRVHLALPLDAGEERA